MLLYTYYLVVQFVSHEWEVKVSISHTWDILNNQMTSEKVRKSTKSWLSLQDEEKTVYFGLFFFIIFLTCSSHM